jgi:hypothetical protein
MSYNIGAVAVRTDTKSINLADIICNVISTKYRELNRDELYTSSNYKENFDFRFDDCFTVFKTEFYIIIANSHTASKFFSADSDLIADKFYSYFNESKQIFAFEYYQSSDTYGYSIIENGKLVRQFKASQLSTTEFGPPLNIECKWLDLPEIDFEEDGENYRGFKHPDYNIIYHKESLYSFLFQEVFKHEIDFHIDDLDYKTIEVKFFRLTK